MKTNIKKFQEFSRNRRRPAGKLVKKPNNHKFYSHKIQLPKPRLSSTISATYTHFHTFQFLVKNTEAQQARRDFYLKSLFLFESAEYSCVIVFFCVIAG